MRKTITHIFSSQKAATEVISNNLLSYDNRLSYAKAEQITLDEGTVYIQYFSHFLFFLEITTFELHSRLEAGYKNEKTRLFLLMLLEGNASFFTKTGELITKMKENTCIATFSRKGEFGYSLSEGKHQFCYIMPRTAWLDRGKDHFPRIVDFLVSMRKDRNLFGHLSPCSIDKELKGLITFLFNLITENQQDIESELAKQVKAIITHYQLLLDKKFSQRVYQIKEFIDKNYNDPYLNNKNLANCFYTTEKTLIQTFKQEFGITPHSYLINIRLENAKNLLTLNKLLPSQVYLEVGYSDFQSFRKQFKKHFGTPPSSST